ncbi:unnamed protein product [Oppiella nova]|uniref:Prolyl 4-hydroxylase alpha subunit domain-containing protein n=1 Tax=Oppiella nova TaxID=334625 RepID=A0A7R9QST8_9ACAR|nr:unnamed protein product [Oppiella nova]CAG2173650.1 unnamed protein product [Oppiella nova]
MSSDGLNRRERVVNRNGDTNEENVSREVSPERPQNQSIMKRVMSLMALSMAILAMVYYTTQSNDTKELVMASATQSITGPPIAQQVMCSQEDYTEDRVRFPSCAPQRCGRFVSDSVVTESEAKHLLSVAKRGLSLGGSSGGMSTLGLHDGTLSMATNFVNFYKLIESTPEKADVFTEKDLEVYGSVRNKVRKTIATHFGVPAAQLYVTTSSDFSRITTKRAMNKYEVYWLRHVDRHNIECDHYTSVIYLSTYGADFSDGRFVFTDQMSNATIEPKLGRLVWYTSGSENEHFLERVTSGTRYALVMGFSCNPKFAAKEPHIAVQTYIYFHPKKY